MPYKPSGTLETPKNPEIKIWRYVSFPKFLSMLDRKALYFTKADKFVDKYEGKYPIANLNKIFNPSQKLHNPKSDHLMWMESFAKSWLRINCWSISDYESPALWRQYVQNNGIAVQSTFKRLADSFGKTTDEVNIGVVTYIDHQIEAIPEHNVFYLYSNKRRNYDYEKELRAFVTVPIPESARSIDLLNNVSGLEIPANLDILIEKVVLYPNASEWLTELVKSIMKKYGLMKKVHLSELHESS